MDSECASELYKNSDILGPDAPQSRRRSTTIELSTFEQYLEEELNTPEVDRGSIHVLVVEDKWVTLRNWGNKL